MRRAVTKSHLGCAQCKRRKVKCDEVVPECGNCVRRMEKCSFLEVALPLGRASQKTASNHTSPDSRVNEFCERSPKALLEVELTYFFLVETLPTILPAAERQDIWRRFIFPQGFAHSEILDVHLATAALHKASITSSNSQDSDLLRFAAEKQTSVLTKFVPMLSGPSADTAQSLFAFSALVTIWAFASAALPSRVNITPMLPFGVEPVEKGAPNRLNGIISIIRISRGVQAVVQQCRPWLIEQGLAALLRSPTPPTPPVPGSCGALDRLLQDLQHSPSITPLQLYAYTTGIERTKDYMHWVGVEDGRQLALGWPVGLSQPFVDALTSYEPASLVILAFWVAGLHATPRTQWWARGLVKGVIDEIAVLLDDTWRQHLAWPLTISRTAEYVPAELYVGVPVV